MTLRSLGEVTARLAIVLALVGCGKDDEGSRGPSAAGAAGASTESGSSMGGVAGAAPGSPARGGASLGDGSGGGSAATLSERYPGDDGIASDTAVVFHDDFEEGWGRWASPQDDTRYLHLLRDPEQAHGGDRYLRSTVTAADLEQDEYISSSTRAELPRRVDEIYWRFHARFHGVAPNPHHWVRAAAGTEAWESSGLANTVPSGDDGFWFDFDADTSDVFNFYVYWYQMRSGRCNDGSVVPGCAGDQGTTYYYGNVFRPPGQSPFPRDEWFCIEIMARANSMGARDGQLAFWIDGALVGEYRQGHPEGTWLRATFHTGGCDFSACTEPVPFEGFDFRSSEDVRFKRIFLDAYYERGSFASKKAELESRGLSVSDEQTIDYDDVVVATERVGCRVMR